MPDTHVSAIIMFFTQEKNIAKGKTVAVENFISHGDHVHVDESHTSRYKPTFYNPLMSVSLIEFH